MRRSTIIVDRDINKQTDKLRPVTCSVLEEVQILETNSGSEQRMSQES